MTVTTSYIKKKIVWTKRDGTVVTLYDEVDTIATDENFDPNNNICTINVYDTPDLYSSGQFAVEEDDSVDVYCKVVTDSDDTAFSDSTDIIWEGLFVDYTRSESPDGKTIQLKLVDFNYHLNNRLWTKSYADLGLKTDEVVVDIVESLMETDSGLGTYRVTTTNIDTTRDDSSVFPVIEPNYSNKPVYEWLNELCSTNWTNSQTEIDTGALVHTKKMIFKIRGNNAYWNYPSASVVMTIDEDTTINEIKIATQNESSANFMIIECGEDFDGEPIYHYAFDKNSSSTIQKDTYEKVLTLAGLNNDYDDQYKEIRAQAISDGLTNAEFIDLIQDLADSYADYWFAYINQSQPQLKVTIPLRTDLLIGDRIECTLTKFYPATYYINKISHSVSDKEAKTQLELLQEIEVSS